MRAGSLGARCPAFWCVKRRSGHGSCEKTSGRPRPQRRRELWTLRELNFFDNRLQNVIAATTTATVLPKPLKWANGSVNFGTKLNTVNGSKRSCHALTLCFVAWANGYWRRPQRNLTCNNGGLGKQIHSML